MIRRKRVWAVRDLHDDPQKSLSTIYLRQFLLRFLGWQRPCVGKDKNVAILALEPDPARAKTIRHIVCDVVRADFRLVRSKSRLLEALSAGIPDLILLPALLSSVDEADLLAHLSTLRDSGHVEILVTPFRFASEDAPREAPSSWRRWWAPGKSTPQRQEQACNPRAFAEQLTWSLQRAQEVRQDRAQRREWQREMEDVGRPSLPVVVPQAVTIADASTLAAVPPSDRRAHRRFAAEELVGLRAARIKHGPQVRLVDCSAGGALIESEVPLRPDSEATLELIGDAQRSIVPFRVVRCHVSAAESRLLYWGACAFTRLLELDDLLRPRPDDQTTSTDDSADRFDVAVKAIVERHVSNTDRDAGSRRSIQASQVRELSTLLREVSHWRSVDPWKDSIREVLAIVIAALQRDEGHAVAFRLVEEQLEAVLPFLRVRFDETPAFITTPDKDVLYLKIPRAGSTPSQVLNVEFSRGSMLEDWQFRLLKASINLAALLEPVRAAEPQEPGERRDRRQHARARGRFDGRWVGAICMPIRIHDISETGCFVGSLHEEEIGRQLSLEIHLPDEGWITVRAEVITNRPAGFAVRFIEMTDEIRTCLARVVAESTDSVATSRPAGAPTIHTDEESPSSKFAQSMIA